MQGMQGMEKTQIDPLSPGGGDYHTPLSFSSSVSLSLARVPSLVCSLRSWATPLRLSPL